MANEIVKSIKEVVDRLKAENVMEGKLQNVTLVEGPEDDVLENATLPVVVWELADTGLIAEKCLGAHAVSSIGMILTCHTRVDNGYYTDEKTGIIDIYEKLLDVIDGGGGVRLNGDGNWLLSPSYRMVMIEKTKLAYIYEIEVTITSVKYRRGALT